jgi:hypothetical protein
MITYNNKPAAEIDIRCSKVFQIIGQISKLISSKDIFLEVKRTIYNTIFIPTLCYQCQTWTLNARTIRKITTTEMRCVRNMTGSSLRDMIKNKDLRKLLGIEAAVFIKRQQIQWLGHIIRQKELNITQRVCLHTYFYCSSHSVCFVFFVRNTREFSITVLSNAWKQCSEF